MRLLSKKPKAPKVPKIICPSCGKPNEQQPEVLMPRCKLCNGILPTMQVAPPPASPAPPALSPDDSAPEDGPVPDTLESFDHGALQYTQFARVAQGPSAVPDDAPAAVFDMGALDVGEPALPRPSSNDA